MEEVSEQKRVKAVMSIFRHARLRVASGNGSKSQATQTTIWAQEDFFVRRNFKRKRWEGSKYEREFISSRNLTKALKIAKSVKRQIWKISRLRNMQTQKIFCNPFFKRKKDYLREKYIEIVEFKGSQK